MSHSPSRILTGKAGFVSLFGSAATASAAIIVNNTPITASSGNGTDTLNWNIDGSGAVEGLVEARFSSENDLGGAVLNNGMGYPQIVEFVVTNFGEIANFAGNPNFVIGPTMTGGFFFSSNQPGVGFSLTSFGTAGPSNFTPTTNSTVGSNGVFGFRFTSGGDTFYGRAEVSFGFFRGTEGSADVTLHSWAYNDQANGPITSGGAAVPEPASAALGLGLLALGAAGLRRMRREKSAA